MARIAPAHLVRTLTPPRESLLKAEEGALVWREMGEDGTPRVAKLYRRRGGLNALRSRVFRFRTEREFRRLRHLERWGIRCTRPLAWGAGRSAAHGWHEVLIMEEVPRAVQLGDFIRERQGQVELSPLFRLVRRMHESGFCHQTLYPANILVRRGHPPAEAYVLSDVPRSWTFPRSLVGTSMAHFDLLDLSFGLVDEGIPLERLPLEAYGDWPGGDPPHLSLDGPDPRAKAMRFRRDAAARIRWVAAWGAIWKERDRPHPLGTAEVGGGRRRDGGKAGPEGRPPDPGDDAGVT